MDSVKALVSDFYINLKLGLKLDLPKGRDTVLELFDRLRRRYPSMDQFKRYRDELALESDQGEAPYRWVAIRTRNIRSGVVNPEKTAQAYEVHKEVLEIAPYFLSISPLDVDYVEVLFGMDIISKSNHDEVVCNALLADSPFGKLFDDHQDSMIDCQPVLGLRLPGDDQTEAHVEIKTRSHGKAGDQPEPISVYLSVRRQGPISDVSRLAEVYDRLSSNGEHLLNDRVLPGVVIPLREHAPGGA